MKDVVETVFETNGSPCALKGSGNMERRNERLRATKIYRKRTDRVRGRDRLKQL